MPTYDYVCSSCHHAWEFEQRIIEAPIETCPQCGQNTAKRQISAGAGFILKGGGWYADLYSSSAKKPSSSDASASEKSTTSTEKPAAAPAAAATSSETPKSGGSSGDKG